MTNAETVSRKRQGKDRFMKIQNDSGIRYLSFGSGAKTMVVVPGLSLSFVTDNAQLLEKNFASFTDDFTVYVFDVKEDVSAGYSLFQMGDDLAAAMQYLGLRDIYMLGCSMGGMESICVAGRYPELVKKMVVAASSCKANPHSDCVFSNWIKLAKDGNYRELTDDMGRKIYSKAVYEANRETFREMADGLTERLLSRFIHCASAMVDADITAEASAVKCPILVVGSLGDEVMTAEASAQIAEITGNELFLYGKEFPHAVYDEAPDFLERVRTFFA